METIDNFEKLKKLLIFNSEDDFYHLQIIKRKKEHKELGSNSYVVKDYYINSVDKLDHYEGEIRCLCDFHQARAMINLNRRSYENIAYHNLRKVTNQILNKDFRSASRSYQSVVGKNRKEKYKRWIVDVDDKSMDEVNKVITFINELEPLSSNPKQIEIVQTKNGYHIITKPFRLDTFRSTSKHEVHKNNPTMLYASWIEVDPEEEKARDVLNKIKELNGICYTHQARNLSGVLWESLWIYENGFFSQKTCASGLYNDWTINIGEEQAVKMIKRELEAIKSVAS